MKAKDYLDGQYLEGVHWTLRDRSQVIIDFFKKYVDKKDSILELGCSGGRNLQALREAGFKNLTGLEMSDKAQSYLKDFKTIHGRYEEVEHGEYDVIFSASFLQELDELSVDKFRDTLSKTKKYFMIFGDALNEDAYYKLITGWQEVEKVNLEPFSQPIRILCRI